MKILFLLLMSLSLWAGIGNIMAMKGSASVIRSSGSVDAKNGLLLLEHDRIQTQKKSRVQVMLNDNTVVTIGANSSFSFDTFSYDGTKKSKVSMSAQRGFFRSVTGKIGKLAPERFKVKTVSATIGIRGTDFSANVMGDREIIQCHFGIITVTYNGEEKEVVAGKQIELRKGSSEVKEMHQQRTSSTQNRRGMENNHEEGIPTEVISDITQIINNPIDVQAPQREITPPIVTIPPTVITPPPVVVTPPVVSPPPPPDPFTITTGAVDRPVQY